ncbi:MAG: TetR/AcrR family transcriptional regulator [Actinobacteria bacterium]|nr:TetR/AcrR family transcriptional regulator [Actinomycetota bacterium]
MVAMADRVKPPTRDRLLAAGMDLFARQGFRATTVGDIEEAAGLVPRRGAMYKHFTSKRALLDAGLELHLAAVDEAIGLLDEAAFGTPLEEARVIGRWLLAELAAEEQLTLILEKEGDRLADFRDRFRERISDAGYRAAGAALRRWALAEAPEGADLGHVDFDALGVVTIGSLINHRRSGWTFRTDPLGVDAERVLDAWLDVCRWTLDGLVGGSSDP